MLASAILALIYAGVGIAPLVYTYLAAREARVEYEKRLESSVEEPSNVNVHVIVVVREDDVETRVATAPVAVEVPGGQAISIDGEDGESLVALQAHGPRLGGVPRSLEAVGGNAVEATS